MRLVEALDDLFQLFNDAAELEHLVESSREGGYLGWRSGAGWTESGGLD
jgi:hypothetical protein